MIRLNGAKTDPKKAAHDTEPTEAQTSENDSDEEFPEFEEADSKLENSGEDPGEDSELEETERNPQEEAETATFQEICGTISKALREPPLNRLNCRLKVLVAEKSAIIYQGLKTNVWGRIREDGRHVIYRHPLLARLREHPDTAKIFKDV